MNNTGSGETSSSSFNFQIIRTKKCSLNATRYVYAVLLELTLYNKFTTTLLKDQEV